MKKKYISPNLKEVLLRPRAELLIASLTGGEVGAPEFEINDTPELPELPTVPGVPGIPGMPGMPSLGPDIPGL